MATTTAVKVKPKSLAQLREERTSAQQSIGVLGEKITALQPAVEWADAAALRQQRALQAELEEVTAFVRQLDQTIGTLEQRAREAERTRQEAAQQARVDAAWNRVRVKHERAEELHEALRTALLEVAEANRAYTLEENKLRTLRRQPGQTWSVGTSLFGVPGDRASMYAWQKRLAPELIRELGGTAPYGQGRHRPPTPRPAGLPPNVYVNPNWQSDLHGATRRRNPDTDDNTQEDSDD